MHLETGHNGARRTDAAPRHHSTHGGLVTFEHGLDLAVGAVGDPAGDALGVGPPLTAVPEEHTLNPTRNEHASPHHSANLGRTPC